MSLFDGIIYLWVVLKVLEVLDTSVWKKKILVGSYKDLISKVDFKDIPC